jgi:hypothetical protein
MASRQHGVVSIRQLLGPLGYSNSAVARALVDGRLHRLHTGVYAVGHTSLSLHGRCLAAVLACGPGAVASHASAAWLWGLSSRPPLPPEATGPVPRRGRLPVVIHRARRLEPADRALVDGTPVTAVPRTLLDMAARLRPEPLRRLLERSEELKLFDLPAVDDLLARTRGHHGNGRLGQAVSLYRPPPFTRSGLERHFLELVREVGLPRPATGFNELGYELDVYWPEYRFAVELEVFETHGTREAFEEDRLRQEDLKLAGIEMIRVTGKRLEREPDEVMRRLVHLLAQRRGGTV